MQIKRKLRFEVFSRTRHELIKKEANIAQTASWGVWLETKHQHGEGKWTLAISIGQLGKWVDHTGLPTVKHTMPLKSEVHHTMIHRDRADGYVERHICKSAQS